MRISLFLLFLAVEVQLHAQPLPPLPIGIATSGYQIEGYEHGALVNWQQWEQKNRTPGDNRTGADHWNRFKEDIALMKELGITSYRFSVEWAKIEPSPGVFNRAAIDHYRELVSEIERAGLEPFVTLHHFTEPQWFVDKGSFTREENISDFLRYADIVINEIAPQATRYSTFNEPVLYASAGYLAGLFPPGHKNVRKMIKVMRHILMAHAKLYRTLHETGQRRGQKMSVGMAHHLRAFQAYHKHNPIERWLAKKADDLFNWLFFDALLTGRFKMQIPGLVWQNEIIAGLKDSQDFVGVNYYSRDTLKMSFWPRELFARTVPDHSAVTDMGWEIYPVGLYEIISQVHQKTKGLPILITENGVATADDSKRIEFMRAHLDQIDRLRREGVPLEGYYIWSLLDNYEWLEGFEHHFGLVGVAADGTRLPKRSFDWLKDLIAQRPSATGQGQGQRQGQQGMPGPGSCRALF